MLQAHDSSDRIQVLYVSLVSGGNNQVFVAVQINVQENRLPRPVGSGDTRVISYFGKRSVSAVTEKRVPHDLRPVGDFAGSSVLSQLCPGRQFSLAEH